MNALRIRKILNLHTLLFAACTVFCVSAALLLGLCLWVRHDVASVTQEARRLYPGGRVQALAALAESDTAPLAQRNRAIWALGQLADARALPALKRLQTHQPCDHAHQVCQYEVEKAVAFCSGTRIQLFAKLLHGGGVEP